MIFVFLIPSLQVGGMERVMSVLLEYFVRKHPENQYHLILYGKRREIYYDIPKQVKVHRPAFDFNNKKRFWHTIKTIFFLRKTVRKINPYSILSFGEIWNNLVLIALWGLQVPLFVSDRCQPDKSLGRLHNSLRAYLYPRAKGVIAQTHQAKSIFDQMSLNNNILVVGNPISMPTPGYLRERSNIILTVGRLIGSKHHKELIKIFNKIRFADWKLVIVGGDALKQRNSIQLKKLIEHLNLEKSVILTGSIKNVEKWYQKSSVFAFPSSSEGFPNVVGEALSHGLPVVSFDCVAGPRDMISNGKNGFLIDLFDFSMFEECLLKLMRNSELRETMSKEAKDSIKKYDSNHVAEKFFHIMAHES